MTSARRDGPGRALRALAVLAAVVAAVCGPPRASAETADASSLFNAGTAALERGDLGRAVAFLKAAERLEPRAADIRRNLTEARARAAAERGAEPPGASPALRPSAPESWWIAAGLIAVGAILSAAPRRSWRRPGGATETLSDPRPERRRRIFSVGGHALLLAGLALSVWLGLRAREEAVHPEAVVVASSLPAGPAPEERPRPPYLLAAGEELHLGRARGARVEIRVAGVAIGWAARSGVWRVADVPRYTAFLPRP